MANMYEELDYLTQSVKKQQQFCDRNVTVGEGKIDNIVGEYGLEKRNERGNRGGDALVEVCSRNKLIITNTQYQHS